MRTPEEKQRLKDWMKAAFLPVWRGQVDDWDSGLNYIADKTGWTPESIKSDVLPWLYEWNRQKDLADNKRKFVAELPNIGVFFRKKKWNNPLPYSFQELKVTDERQVTAELCACGGPAFNRKLCCRCYTKLTALNLKEEIRGTLEKLGIRRSPQESWRDACMRGIKNNNLKVPYEPKTLP